MSGRPSFDVPPGPYAPSRQFNFRSREAGRSDHELSHPLPTHAKDASDLGRTHEMVGHAAKLDQPLDDRQAKGFV